MRLWHKDLIPYLPNKQLLSQWRECCAIVASIAKKGTPNHILVNKVLTYSSRFLINYSHMVIREIENRRFKINKKSYDNFCKNFIKVSRYWGTPYKDLGEELYHGWHNDRYLRQCLFNLQEKYDCGGISEDEWKVIEYHFAGILEWR